MIKPDDHSPVPEEAVGYKDPDIEGFKPDDSVRDMALKSQWTQAQYEGFVQQLATDKNTADDGQKQWRTDQKVIIGERLGEGTADHLVRTVSAIKESNPDLAEAITAGNIDGNIVLALDSLVHQILDMGGEAAQFNDQAGAGVRGLIPEEAMNKARETRELMLTLRPSDKRYPKLMADLVEYQRLASASA
jgi:hypothetical protein